MELSAGSKRSCIDSKLGLLLSGRIIARPVSPQVEFPGVE